MLTNKAFLAAAVCRFCGAYGSLVIQTKLPAYLEDVLHESVSENGISNSFIFLSIAALQVAGPYVSEIVIARRWLSKTGTRKAFAALSLYGLTAAFIAVPFTGCNATYALVALIAGTFVYGTSQAGDVIVPAEISYNFSATIYAIINMLANIPGFVAPIVIGSMLEGADDGTDIKHRWDRVFFMTAGIVAFGATMFMIFGSAERQEFDKIEIRNRNESDSESNECK
jgi:ACS family sodium-dependent inorganic phosphate cotransporter-like MFS transporter 5